MIINNRMVEMREPKFQLSIECIPFISVLNIVIFFNSLQDAERIFLFFLISHP